MWHDITAHRSRVLQCAVSASVVDAPGCLPVRSCRPFYRDSCTRHIPVLLLARTATRESVVSALWTRSILSVPLETRLPIEGVNLHRHHRGSFPVLT